MSQPMPEARPLPPPPGAARSAPNGARGSAPAPAASGGTGTFTRKLGPLPTWAWIVIAVVLLVGVSWFRSRGKSASPATSAGTSPATSGAGQVPQFVNQTYTTVTPPSAPAVQPGGPVHPKPPVRRPHPEAGGTKTRRAETLATISQNYKASIPDLIKWNPHLKPYQHGGKVPKGTTVVTHNPSGFLSGK